MSLSKNFFMRTWNRSFYLNVISIYLYVFMEWLFFATKPSFMSVMNEMQKFQIYFVSCSLLIVPVLIFTISFNFLGARSKLLKAVDLLLPSFILSLLTLILFDNFAYTVFKFGIVTSMGISRLIYGMAFLVLFLFLLVYFFRNYIMEKKIISPLIHYLSITLFTASIISIAIELPNFNFRNEKYNLSSSISTKLPNIILIGIDGVNANSMSVYGYQHDTTPNITKLAKNAFVMENAFSNAGNTGGSLTSILTGRLPTETRVLYPPDALMGEDAYQHLPGILKHIGYETVQITDNYFGDAYSRNIKNGFDTVNFRSESTIPLIKEIERYMGGASPYFLSEIIQRASDRIKHIFLIREMVNPMDIVTEPATDIAEKDRYKRMIKAISDAKGPLFLHVHMLVTHGPKFNLRKNVFSIGQVQDQNWMIDFYDDAILDSDQYIQELFSYLNKKKITNTIVILYSDHNKYWNTNQRIPLIIWFPNSQFAGINNQNVQLLDVAPTILDYLNEPKPDWMIGQSMLQNNPSDRRIFSAIEDNQIVTERFKNGGEIFPPFYQLGRINLVVCNQWFSLNMHLDKPGLIYGEVQGSTVPCDKTAIPAPEQAKNIILEHLQQNGYDISSYPKEIVITHK